MCLITGILYWRRKRGLSTNELVGLSGVSICTILTLERKIKTTTCLTIYRKIAEALDVSIEDLIADYDCPEGKKRGRERRKLDGNAIAVYCRVHDFTYQQLADRLGLTSRERARQICRAADVSEKHIKKLAEFEGLTMEEFYEQYAA